MGLSVELNWVAQLFIWRIKGEFSWRYSEFTHSPIHPFLRCIVFVHSVIIDSLSLLEICSSVYLHGLHTYQFIFTKVRIIFAVGRLHGRWTTLPYGKNIICGRLRLWCWGKCLDRREIQYRRVEDNYIRNICFSPNTSTIRFVLYCRIFLCLSVAFYIQISRQNCRILQVANAYTHIKPAPHMRVMS
jgi:hypothetical protein